MYDEQNSWEGGRREDKDGGREHELTMQVIRNTLIILILMRDHACI